MNSSYSALSLFKRGATILLLVCICLEMIFHLSPENAFGCLAELYGWLLISKTVLKWKYLHRFCLPFITILFYGICFFILPIPATLLEGKPLTFRFAVPYLTFFNLMLNVTTIVLAFHACRLIYREGWLTSIWKKIGYFTPPTSAQIWALSFVGLIALLWSLGTQGTDMYLAENLGMWGQFLINIRTLAYAPIAFLFVAYWGGNADYSKSKKILFIYLFLLSLIAIASTKRALLVNMVVSSCVMALIVFFYENRKFFTTKTTIYFIVVAYLVTGPVADMAVAMAVMRSSVYNNNSSVTFEKIIDLYSDKEQLHHLYQIGTFSNSDNKGDNFAQWSEYYIDNIFLDRFCNLRTQDITLDYARKLGYGNERMQNYADNFIVFQVPTPILKAFGFEGNKFESYYSPGDLLSTDALDLKQQYMGFRVCGDSGAGLAWMGYIYYVFAFLIYVCLFYFMSSLVSSKSHLLLPVPIIMSMQFYMTYFNNSTGIFRTLAFLLRQGWQDILIYCILISVIKIFISSKRRF